MRKEIFEDLIEKWILDYCKRDASIQVLKIYKQQNISKLNDPLLQGVKNIEKCDFSADFFVLIKKADGNKDFILINRYVKSVGLRAIGEMLVYSSVSNPHASFVISTHGHSSEINSVLMNEQISNELFCYDQSKHIKMFTLNGAMQVDPTSILPLSVRANFDG